MFQLTGGFARRGRTKLDAWRTSGMVTFSLPAARTQTSDTGELVRQIATVLMGKHRPDYTAHVDTGDFVIVTNAEKIRLTGKKAETKEYQHYTYHFGGRKVISFAKMLQKKPEKVISEAVRRMLPKNSLARQMLKKLKVYRGSDHPHAAQQPVALELN